MRFLLDTHVLLWWLTDDPQLSPQSRTIIMDEANTILVSSASAWEIATKHRLGKLEIGAIVVPRFNELVQLDGFEHLPITYLHTLKAGSYPVEHRDPFDRMLAAQSDLEAAVLITRDTAFEAFRTRTIW